MALTQPEFAKRFDVAMDDLELQNTDIQLRTAGDGGKKPINANTVKDYRTAEYPHGPPEDTVRRRLERAMEVYRGFLDGDWDDVLAVEQRKKLRRGEAPPGARHDPGLPLADRVRVGADNDDDPPESFGLVFGDDDEAHLRDLLHDVQRTLRSDPPKRDGRTATRYLLLGALTAYETSVTHKGRKAPAYFATIREEITHDRFD